MQLNKLIEQWESKLESTDINQTTKEVYDEIKQEIVLLFDHNGMLLKENKVMAEKLKELEFLKLAVKFCNKERLLPKELAKLMKGEDKK